MAPGLSEFGHVPTRNELENVALPCYFHRRGCCSGPMLTALPESDFNVQSFAIKPAKIGRVVDDGDLIDLGDSVFEVMHLPGHSPGGIGLWEKNTETLFSGDAIYDGPLLDSLHHSNIQDYIKTMNRLRELPVRTVHAGHDPSFGRDRLIEIANYQLKLWSALL